MSTKKLRRKGGKKKKKAVARGSRKTRFTVRLARDKVLQIHSYASLGDTSQAIQLLKILKPELGPDEAHEVVMRCSDPGRYGGITTGDDPELGAYADICVT